MQGHIGRRHFLRAAGLGSLAALGHINPVEGSVPPETTSAIKNAEPMKITKIEAVRFRRDLKIDGEEVRWMWVRLHTNNGIVGVG
jgi:hypothetical protein